MYRLNKLVILGSLAVIFVISCSLSDSIREPHSSPVGEELSNTSNNKPFSGIRKSTDLFADTILIKAKVITMESALPVAEALAIKDGRILSVGSNEYVMSFGGAETLTVDLGGKTVLPGFVDAHNHMFSEAVESGRQTLEEVQTYALTGGITAMADMSVGPSVIEPIIDFAEQGRLKVRTSLYLSYNDNCGGFLGDWYLDYPVDKNPQHILRIPGVKIFTDGWTCDLLPAFTFSVPDAPRRHPKGHLFMDRNQLEDAIIKVQKLGYQAAMHALGDRAVENALDAVENVLSGKRNSFRHRLEHNMYIRPELLPRYGKIGVIPVVWDSMACFIEDVDSHNRSWSEIIYVMGGPETYSWINPWKSLLASNNNLIVAYHSDASYGGTYPIHSLYSYVTRKDVRAYTLEVCDSPDWMYKEAISVQEALRIMTIDSAYSIFMEENIGSLKEGKFADLIVVSNDPTKVNNESLKDIKILVTMVGGNIEYCDQIYVSLCN